MSKKSESQTKNAKGTSQTKDKVGGTINIARGQTNADLLKKRKQIKNDKLSTLTPQEKERIGEYYHNGSTSKFNNQQRRKNYQIDDQNPNSLSKLNPHQQRSLVKRRRIGDRAIKTKINRLETKRLEAAVAATDAELVLHTEQSGFLEAETEMERTYKLNQEQLKLHLDEQTSRHIFDLKLDQYSPYGLNYDRSGRCGVLYGKSGGHIALMDMHTLSLKSEFHLNERVRDATFLHNTTMVAVAQQKNVFIYDDTGAEIHRMTEHTDVFRMEFLPHHWLLSTVGRAGYLKYHDTSTGDLVSTHRTRLGACKTMTQNKNNSVIHCGHLNGTVTLWSPASSQYLVKMLCHKGAAVHSMAIDRTGRYMVTGGADSQVKIWDLRMYKETHAYYTKGGAPTSIDISQKGVIGIGHGSNTTFWSPDALHTKVKDPYMSHLISGKGPVETLSFRPFEDVCGIGHAKGISSIVIPGSGEANLDSMEYNTNPYQDTKQRREGEVRALLDKLSPDMIALDPDVIGTVEESDANYRLERQMQIEKEANAKKLADEEKPKPKEKKRMRGRSKYKKKLARKNKNVIDENKLKLQEAMEKERAEKKRGASGGSSSAGGGDGGENSAKDEAPVALKRFFK